MMKKKKSGNKKTTVDDLRRLRILEYEHLESINKESRVRPEGRDLKRHNE